MKNKNVIICIIFILLILFGSIFSMWSNVTVKISSKVTKENISVTDGNITVSYITGKNVNETIGYNNFYTIKLLLKNNSNNKVYYSLFFDNEYDTNNNFSYTLSASKDNKNFKDLYDGMFKRYLGYNMVLDANKKVYINIILKSIDNLETNIKGEIIIKKNISEKEFFMFENETALNTLKNKIEALNGISNAGVYIYNVSDIENINIKGFIVVDASNITDIKYYLFTTDEKSAFYKIDESNVNVNNIYDYDGGYNEIDENGICNIYTGSNMCGLVTNLTYNEFGSQSNFYINSIALLNEAKEKTLNISNKVIILDVLNDIGNSFGIRGYILADKTKEIPEYYLYLTNNLYMISGYNVTKHGDNYYNTGTIRPYVESAFNLSSVSYNTVCSFSGFNECYFINQDLIQ